MPAKTAAHLVAEAQARVENLAPEQVAAAVAAELARGETLLVDFREAAERAEAGTITGAIHAPRGMLEVYADPTSAYHRLEFDPNRRVLLSCASGGRSALAADRRREMGYGRVAHLAGGPAAWRAADRPVEPGA